VELKLLYKENLLEEKSKALIGIKMDSPIIYINFTLCDNLATAVLF
jgi:hypothetical protein